MKGLIKFNKTSTPIEVTNIKSYSIMQSGHNIVMHEVHFEKNGLTRKMTFMNYVEATMLGSRFVPAQSNISRCATIEILED
jgi:hypothetical protein